MNSKLGMNRRKFLIRSSAAGSALFLGGCDSLSQSPAFRDLLARAEGANQAMQRLVLSSRALAREYSEGDIYRPFRANGNTDPQTNEYLQLANTAFKDWRLEINGLVDRPASLSLEDLRKLPSRTQITRHDCVEGWSAIGKWTGAQLAPILQSVGLKPDARYLIFHCADSMGIGEPYYESIDLIDAFHPQTILAYDLNGEALPVANGAPLRVRIERQLGYKMAKYVMRIEAVSSFAKIGRGNGGYWEDNGYEWYAGI
jgi:DMSO/TMAO reductase YedYZ molybdopterin-dependent catalytic subunit